MSENEVQVFEREAPSLITQIKTAAKSLLAKWNDDIFLDLQKRREEICRRLKVIDTFCDPGISAAHNTHKLLINKKGTLTAPYKTMQMEIDYALSTAKRERDRKIREEEERKRKLETQKQEEHQLKLATQAEKAGDHVAANAIISAAPVAPPIHVPEAPTIQGARFREVWTGRVTDLRLLIKAIHEGKAPISFIMIDQASINAAIKKEKTLFQCPGVVAQMEEKPVTTIRGEA